MGAEERRAERMSERERVREEVDGTGWGRRMGRAFNMNL